MATATRDSTPEKPRAPEVGVIGAGIMGRGIAQLFSQSGARVRLLDAAPGAAAAAVEAIDQVWSGLVAKGRLEDSARRSHRERLVVIDELSSFKDCDLVVEAIVERLDVKRELFGRLEQAVERSVILASNTSSLSITAIAAGARFPGRIAGLHFFNPVPLMKIVEVIGGSMTDAAVCERLMALVRTTGHTAVRAADMPGFLINHAGRGYGTEALRVAGEGVASFEVIDRIMREQVRFSGGGFRLGPFELLDLTGLDVSQAVMESIFEQFYHEPRFTPSPIGAQRRAAGLFGRKNGQGFYDYRPDGTGPRAPAMAGQTATPAGSTAVAGTGQAQVAPVPVHLTASATSAGLQSLVERLGGRCVDSADDLGSDGFVLTAPLGVDASGDAVAGRLAAEKVVAIDTLFDPAASGVVRRSLMPTVATDPRRFEAAATLFGRDGASVSRLRDSTGFVAQRIVAMVISVATEIAQQRIATAQDIDLAVRMGLGYPVGPLSMGDELGPARVLAVLEGIHRTTGDPRYRPGPWLRRRAALGLSLLTED
ncbi:MAG: 3-hydroxyacyl-CoA dehydrogenase [Burkholderiaceae bacterium]